MSEYTLYFQIGTKKLRHTLDAYSREDAIARLRQKIEVLRVEEELPEVYDGKDPAVEHLKSMFGMK